MSGHPALIDFPECFESRRLTIRSPRFGDGRAVNEAIADSFAELTKWMPWAREMPTVEQSEEYCRLSQSRFLAREDLPLLLFLKEGGTLVGASGLHRIDWSVPKFEIGYWVRTAYGGRGLIGEAVLAIARLALRTLGAGRVEIRADPRNERSWRIAEKLGFRLEGVFRNDGRDADGNLRSSRIYAIVSEEELIASGE